MAAAALLPVLAILLAAPFVPDLQAQTERTLVSNTNQPYYLIDFNRVSQPFRTGSNGPGYVLTTVGVRVYNTRTTVENPDVSVRIYTTNASNRPNDLLYVLVSPTTITSDSVATFTAPTGSTLSANTTYAVVISDSAGTGDAGISIHSTSSDAQDSGAAVGWSIGNARHVYIDSGAWARDDSSSVMIEIKGAITPNYPATGDPTISGAAQVGMTLTASTSDIMDANGLTGAVYAYQWIRVTEDGTETNVGTDTGSYALTAADQGHHMKVRVTFTDDGGTEETRISGESSLVLPAAVSNCGLDTFWCGVLTVGHDFDEFGRIESVGFGSGFGSLDDVTFTHEGVNYTITSLIAFPLSSHTLWLITEPALPVDAAGNLVLHVQKYSGELILPFSEAQSSPSFWLFTDALIVPPSGSLSDVPLLRPFTGPGATRLAGATDIGTRLGVRLSRLNTAATGQPSVSGFPRVGGLLRAGLGTIKDSGGLPGTFPDNYDLQWVRVDGDGISNPQDIAGATSGTYTPVAADVGKKIKVKVSFTDARGVAEGPLESEPTPAAVREASSTLLETTLTVGLIRSGNSRTLGCASTNNVNDCSDPDVMANNTFVSTDAGGVAKEFEIVDLQLTHAGWSDRLQLDQGEILAIVFGGIRELRDYEVNNLVLVLDGTRFPFQDADAGGYHVRTWWNADLNWNAGDTVQLQILDAPGSGIQQPVPPPHEPPSQPAVLTASFEDTPSSHDGSSVFTTRVRFSEALASGGAQRRLTQRLAATGGAVRMVRRVDRRRDLFQFQVQPSGNGAVTVILPASASCDFPHALCTPDGKALSSRIKVTVPGPHGLSVADAEVEEGVGATLDFILRLSRVSSETVTVRISTSNGSATAGDDYVAKSETVTFAPGVKGKVFSVTVLDDNLNEGNEYMTVTLSNPSGAYLADATATGTIENSDPMPRAWLARFGRTVGTHVTDAVGDRLRSTSGQGSHVIIGGYRLPLGDVRTGTARAGHETGPSTGEPGASEWGVQSEVPRNAAEESVASEVLLEAVRFLGLGSGYAARPGRLADNSGPVADTPRAVQDTPWLDRTGSVPRSVQSRTFRFGDRFDLRRVLLDSNFRVSVNGAEPGDRAPRLTAWGLVAVTRFDGRDDALQVDGDVLTGTVGVDGEWDRWLTGVAVAHSRGDGSYAAQGVAAQDLAANGQGGVDQTLTSIHPYLRFAVHDRLDVWGVFGYGRGELTLTPAGSAALQTDANLLMGAFGGRGIVLPATDAAGIQLATRTDAMLTRTTSDAVTGPAGNLAATDADAHRLRVILEGSRGFEWTEGQRLTPTVELGLRHDRGDAETGFGLEVGGRVRYADPAWGLTVEGTVRGLLAHEDEDYKEWGASGRLQVSRGPEGRGLSLALAPAWGVTASGVEALWSRQTTAGIAPQIPRQARTGRLVSEVGYGVEAFGGGLLTPYAGSELADGAARRFRVGTRLQLAREAATGLTLNLEGRRQERADPQPVDQDLRIQIRWRF